MPEGEVFAVLGAIPEVKEARMVYCFHDIIAQVEIETMQKLKNVISWKIRRARTRRTKSNIVRSLVIPK